LAIRSSSPGQSGESKERQGAFCTRIEEEDVLRSAARLFHLEGINAKRWRGANTALSAAGDVNVRDASHWSNVPSMVTVPETWN
jgi:hypothetical protein